MLFAVTMLMACAASQRTMAQTLTVYQKGGTTTKVACSEKFKQTIASEFLIITADSSNYTFFLSDVDSVTYSQTVGDVNRDGQVGIGDIVAITNIMAGTEESAETGKTKTYTVNGVTFTI